MGVFGAGLYSGDFAMDLRSTVSAVARLPHGGDKLVQILCESEPAAANNPDDEDHTTFWLVAADQFAKRAIKCERVRDKALAIIDSGTDLAMLGKLGMNPSGLRKRQKMLLELRERITAPATPRRPRPVIKKPQTLLMDVGDVLVYPTFGGRCRNPYFASKEQDRMGTMTPAWTRDGWSAMVIIDCGRAFDFLAWYRPITICRARPQKPTLDELRGEVLWRLARPGTCSQVHFRRMEFQKIGALPIDPDKLRQAFPGMRPGARAAVSDISIANGVSVAPYVPEVLMPNPGAPVNYSRGKPYPTLLGIGQILSS
ncbi:MAG TPA: hypothetical protein VFZ27_05380 [Terriglobia bacterium]|nr:hypothetical protein [Terriglobia bacterium]